MSQLTAPPGKIVLVSYTKKTASGVEVSEGKKDESRIGIVYAFGTPLEKDPQIKLKKGQKVVFKKYVSNTLFIPELSDSFDFIEYEDVVAILNDE